MNMITLGEGESMEKKEIIGIGSIDEIHYRMELPEDVCEALGINDPSDQMIFKRADDGRIFIEKLK